MIVGLCSLLFFRCLHFLCAKYLHKSSLSSMSNYLTGLLSRESHNILISSRFNYILNPIFLYLCLLAVAFCWEENAVHLATVNMSKLVWRNWSTGATKQLMRYLGLLPLAKHYSPCLLFSLMKGTCSVYRISLGGAQAYKTGNWIFGNASSNLD